MKHLKVFNSLSEYQSFKSGDKFVLPNISYVEGNGVLYNPYSSPATPIGVSIYGLDGKFYSVAEWTAAGKSNLDAVGVAVNKNGHSFVIHPTAEQADRIADKWRVEYREDGLKPITLGPKINWLRLTDNYDSGGAGLFGNAEQYIKMVDALANGGVAENGYRVLKPETIDLMRTNQLGGDALKIYTGEYRRRIGYGYGLGVRTAMDPKAIGTSLNCQEFGWDGAAGSYVMIDPVNHISLVYVEHVMNHSDIYTYDHLAFRDMTYQSMGL